MSPWRNTPRLAKHLGAPEMAQARGRRLRQLQIVKPSGRQESTRRARIQVRRSR